MARKESVTKKMIIDTAFELVKEEGIQNVTARKLAGKIGCSTQPIFRVYSNMNELIEEIYLRSIDTFANYYENYESEIDIPFIHLGLAYINFAREHKELFKLLFTSDIRGDRSLYELLNGKTGALTNEINKAAENGCENPSGVFMKMWIFIHGCACMVLTGDFDLTGEETAELLADLYKSCS